MEFRQLDTFQKISRVHSFSKAAHELGYAQSTVTMQIRLLEEELGVKLFDRLGHHISLTSEGNKLLPIADQILRLSVDARETMRTCNQPSGTLVIGALESLCIYSLSRVIKEYKCRYPAVNIIIKFGSEERFLKEMRGNTINVLTEVGCGYRKFIDEIMSEYKIIPRSVAYSNYAISLLLCLFV